MWSKEELEKLFKQFEQKKNPKLKLMFEVLLGSGLRVKELTRMKVKDITFTGSYKGKIETSAVKKGAPHATTMTDDLTDKVNSYRKANNLGPDDIMFTNRYGKPFTSGHSLNKTLNYYAKKAGIKKKISNHHFRHLFATDIIKRCGLVTAQEFLGHADIKTTMIYGHVTFEDHQLKFKQSINKG